MPMESPFRKLSDRQSVRLSVEFVSDADLGKVNGRMSGMMGRLTGPEFQQLAGLMEKIGTASE